MTIAELAKSPTGTTVIKISHDVAAGRYFATHWERVQKAIKPTTFYAETEEAARELAEAYDTKRKEQYAQWRNSAKQRREILKRSRTDAATSGEM